MSDQVRSENIRSKWTLNQIRLGPIGSDQMGSLFQIPVMKAGVENPYYKSAGEPTVRDILARVAGVAPDEPPVPRWCEILIYSAAASTNRNIPCGWVRLCVNPGTCRPARPAGRAGLIAPLLSSFRYPPPTELLYQDFSPTRGYWGDVH